MTDRKPGWAYGPVHIAREALIAAETAALVNISSIASTRILATALYAIERGKGWPIPWVFGGGAYNPDSLKEPAGG